jgi:hypothetical protein
LKVIDYENTGHKRCFSKCWLENLNGRDVLGGLHVKGRLILKCQLGKCPSAWTGGGIFINMAMNLKVS